MPFEQRHVAPETHADFRKYVIYGDNKLVMVELAGELKGKIAGNWAKKRLTIPMRGRRAGRRLAVDREFG